MISIANILTVARIEAKTLWRSWFFRILSILAVVGIGLANFGVLSHRTFAPWEFKAVSSSIPYLNILLLNTVQAVIAVFLASDFLRRDRKLDTTEVVYMRSMTNADYVAGKTTGILAMFLLLNAAVLLIGAVFNVFFARLPFAAQTYLYYPLLLSLPTLVFMLGLAFLLMIVIRNQALTFIILLGYIGTSLFYLGPRVHHLFDYIGFTAPMLHSGFTGFADPLRLVMQRGIYLLAGLGCIAATIAMLQRLPQSRLITVSARAAVFVCFAAAAALAIGLVGMERSGVRTRERMRRLADAAAAEPVAVPLSCAIDLRHAGRAIEASARIAVRNDGEDPLGAFLFNLNPGFTVAEVRGSGEALAFEREMHLLRIRPPAPLSSGGVDSFTIRWSGAVDEQALYTDIDERTLAAASRIALFNVGKRYAYIEPAFLLLTPETQWYPAAGPGFAPSRPLAVRRDFIAFSLDVRTVPGLTAISQGTRSGDGNGIFSFRPEDPLPMISLAIAPYENRSTMVDSVEYALYTRRGHDYFSEYFSEIGDTLGALITDIRRDFESTLGLEYPFPRLSLVEVPVHFSAYYHVWSVRQETVLPEMVLLPERGATIRGADFSSMSRRMEQHGRRSNMQISERENQAGMFLRFIGGTLTESFGRPRFDSDDPFSRMPSFNVFPNLLTFRTSIASPDMPYLDMALEGWYLSRIADGRTRFLRFMFGLTPDERVNLRLAEHSLREILADEEARNMAHFALKAKGTFLLSTIEARSGRAALDKLFSRLFDEYRFRRIPTPVLAEALRSETGIDFVTLAGGWYDETDLPGFLISQPQLNRILDGERERFQLLLAVSNPENVDGLIHVQLRQRDLNVQLGRGFGPVRTITMRGGGLGGEDVQRYVAIGAGETKEIGFVLDFQPSSLEIQTLISRNLPAVIEVDLPTEAGALQRAQPFDGERLLDRPVADAGSGEIIVNNEDPGFSYSEGESASLLRRLLPGRADEDEPYVGMHLWQAVNRWLPTVNAKFHGGYVRSARFTSGGRGERVASFTAELDAGGRYDIYFHVSKIASPWRGRRGGEENYGRNHLRVQHDDGVEEIELDLNTAEDGWNYLGSYYLSPGAARVELSNRSDGRVVIADAVKWVRR